MRIAAFVQPFLNYASASTPTLTGEHGGSRDASSDRPGPLATVPSSPGPIAPIVSPAPAVSPGPFAATLDGSISVGPAPAQDPAQAAVEQLSRCLAKRLASWASVPASTRDILPFLAREAERSQGKDPKEALLTAASLANDLKSRDLLTTQALVEALAEAHPCEDFRLLSRSVASPRQASFLLVGLKYRNPSMRLLLEALADSPTEDWKRMGDAATPSGERLQGALKYLGTVDDQRWLDTTDGAREVLPGLLGMVADRVRDLPPEVLERAVEQAVARVRQCKDTDELPRDSLNTLWLAGASGHPSVPAALEALAALPFGSRTQPYLVQHLMLNEQIERARRELGGSTPCERVQRVLSNARLASWQQFKQDAAESVQADLDRWKAVAAEDWELALLATLKPELDPWAADPSARAAAVERLATAVNPEQAWSGSLEVARPVAGSSLEERADLWAIASLGLLPQSYPELAARVFEQGRRDEISGALEALVEVKKTKLLARLLPGVELPRSGVAMAGAFVLVGGVPLRRRTPQD